MKHHKTKEKKLNFSTLKSQDFRYNFLIFLKSLFHFPVIYCQSKGYLTELFKYLQTYPRNGVIDGQNGCPVQVNTVEHYLDNSQKRGLVDLNFVYSPVELNKIQEVEIFNEENQKISALILKQPNARKWVIGLHGWTTNKYLALQQTYLYSQLGYNILTFDARGHGASYGDFTDIGYSNSQDLYTVLKWLEKLEEVETYGIVGMSMGGASVMKYAEEFGYRDPKLKFIVDDAGFNNLLIELRFILENNFHKPWWQVGYGIKKFVRQKLGVNLKNYDLMKKVAQLKEIPILFIHGLDDDLVPIFNSQEFYKEKIQTEKEPKSEILTAKGIKHVRMVSDANQLYVATITKFLTTIGEIQPKINKK